MRLVCALVLIFLAASGEAAAAARDNGCSGLIQCLFGASQRPSATTGRQVVAYAQAEQYPQGAIIVSTPERRLYLVLGSGKAISYPVGVGKQGYQWSGTSKVVRKAKWPSWTPPVAMIQRARAEGLFLPDELDGGPNNPLGARALYIGGTLYRIHGTNQEASIGHEVSSGCIRMKNDDVIDLYNRVRIGAPVHVIQ